MFSLDFGPTGENEVRLLLLVFGLVISVDEAVPVEELGYDVGFKGHVEWGTCLLALEQVWVITHLRRSTAISKKEGERSAPVQPRPYLPELHNQVHQGRGGAVGLLSRAHGRLQQILYGDLVPQGLIEQLLPQCQLAVGQDLDLFKEDAASLGQGQLPDRLLLF